MLGRAAPSHGGKMACVKLHLMLRLQKCIYTSTPPNALVACILSKLRHYLTSLIHDEMKLSINSGNQVSHSLLPSEMKKFLTNSTPTGVLLTWSHSTKVIQFQSRLCNTIFWGEVHAQISLITLNTYKVPAVRDLKKKG